MLQGALQKLNAKEITELIKVILLAYHMREQDRLEEIVNGINHTDQWYKSWPSFVDRYKVKEDALVHFSQYIQSQLDGGDYSG